MLGECNADRIEILLVLYGPTRPRNGEIAAEMCELLRERILTTPSGVHVVRVNFWCVQ
jgi:hypothetical protein